MGKYDKELYINRELSWLEFNQRVLDEVKSSENPLFEQMKFLAIVASNLDEFFMVRVGSLEDQVIAGFEKEDPSGLKPMDQLDKISERAYRMMEEQYALYNDAIIPMLDKFNIKILKPYQFNRNQMQYIDNYFHNFIYPVLTPMAVDSSRPFPLIQNKSINIGALIKNDENDGQNIFATVQMPSVLPRILEIPNEENQKSFVLLEEVIRLFLEKLYPGKTILCSTTYRVTRNGDLSIDEDEAEDLLLEIQKSIKKRSRGQAVRLEYEKDAHPQLIKILRKNFELKKQYSYELDGPLDLMLFFSLYKIDGYESLKYEKYTPCIPKDLIGVKNIFEEIKNRDLFMHHPYESFEPMVKMIQLAAQDPQVLAIKQTLYRVSGDSPIIKALTVAAEKGKQVTVLVELKARFDEENNILWAKSLEKAGCHVIYGLVGLKTHSKITLFVRKEDDGINRYVHLGTGNYNDITACIYTDMGILTSDKYIGRDASDFFNALSGYAETPRLNKLIMAPIKLRESFLKFIKREVKNAKNKQEAKIIVKVNSLIDPEIIDALYDASRAGVKIELIVRGICGIRPGVKGISENIIVRSIVGRYLEHSRIYYFYNEGKEDLFISSADWMTRNLDRRVELLIPVTQKAIRKRIIDILEITLKDNVKAKFMSQTGEYYYEKYKEDELKINSQQYLMNEAEESEKVKKNFNNEQLVPRKAMNI